ncbi:MULTISPECIES: hypothetical protein [unclassified Avibacterium]|uniref:hypothetical protein n=1 Tax=unclassified Avibacterium TaxID=2685287 RepID=UPI002026D65E|nr:MULTISPECIES: hypothetical protein [unclassified Avibacterium]MCW9698099.1 hypothetical protein [Avibacterium sp. 20-129]URL05580.1 hypothetical protein L4F92_05660 [Avibacterium sp. 21-595]
MNYRVLFITAFLILIVGISGIFFYSSDNSSSQPQQTVEVPQPEPEQPAVENRENNEKKKALFATVNKNIPRGHILKQQDIVFSELPIDENSVLMQYDLTSFLSGQENPEDKNTEDKRLRGFTVSQDVAQGDYLSPKILISPDDERFISYTIDPTREVAHTACIYDVDSSSLETLQAGDNVAVSVFAGKDSNPNKVKFVPVFKSVKLLQIKKTPVTEESNKNELKTCAFKIRLKLEPAQLKTLYLAATENRLLILPENTDKQPIKQNGTLIRSLRGN